MRFFFLKDGILYDTTDGQFQQNICVNIIWLLSVLAFTYMVIIDRFISSPGNGRIKLYGIIGSDKSYYDKKYTW